MARDKTDKTDLTPATPTAEALSRAEIEAFLDRNVAGILTHSAGKETVPGAHILWPLGPHIVSIGQAEILTLTEEKAAALVNLAETNPHAFDAASYLAGMLFAIGHIPGAPDCPISLRSFGAQALTGEIQRPPQPGRPRAGDTALRLWKYSLCRFMAECTPLPLGRNREEKHDTTLGFSACDAVAESFTRCGHHETYGQLVSLCYDVGHADLRALAEAVGMLDFSEED